MAHMLVSICQSIAIVLLCVVIRRQEKTLNFQNKSIQGLRFLAENFQARIKALETGDEG